MEKFNKEFPVYALKNWNSISDDHLEKLIEIVIRNREKHKHPQAASFWLMDDDDGTFKILYDKFFNFVTQEFQLTPTDDNTRYCNVYYNKGSDAIEVLDPHGRQYYHTHKHVKGHLGSSTTIAGVYYLNIPDPDSGWIDFKKEELLTENGLVDISKDMQYHQFSQRPYERIEGIRESIIKEISYQPTTGDLVIFPSYLEHRPHKSLKPGHRIAVNFELKTKEHPDVIFGEYDKRNKLI
jgi:hypothetical protein